MCSHSRGCFRFGRIPLSKIAAIIAAMAFCKCAEQIPFAKGSSARTRAHANEVPCMADRTVAF